MMLTFMWTTSTFSNFLFTKIMSAAHPSERSISFCVFFFQKFYSHYGKESTAERRECIVRHNLAFLPNAELKLYRWCRNKFTKEPRERRVPKPNKKNYISSITTNLLRHHKFARSAINPCGCGPYCKGSGKDKRRNLICESCDMRFHTVCVDENLLKEVNNMITLPECHFCLEARQKGWDWFKKKSNNYCVF